MKKRMKKLVEDVGQGSLRKKIKEEIMMKRRKRKRRKMMMMTMHTERMTLLGANAAVLNDMSTFALLLDTYSIRVFV
jgi:hypothetical protein